MKNTVVINNKQFPAIEYRGRRIVTFAMVDEVHERPQDTARAAFNRNRAHFIEGVDFLELTADVIRTESLYDVFAPRTAKGIVLFESGYLMLTKPFKFMTPDGLLSRRAIVEFDPFISAFRQMMSEAEPRGTRWHHPKMGLFQVLGWEA